MTVPLLAVRMSMNADVRRITPPTLMFISAINPSRSVAGTLRFLWSMMPALFKSTSSFGYPAFTRPAREAICAGSATSLWMVWSFGYFAFSSSSTDWRRPITMTWLPSSRNLRAKARPMPAEPPVIRIVRPVIFIRLLCSFDFCQESFRLWTQGCLSLIARDCCRFYSKPDRVECRQEDEGQHCTHGSPSNQCVCHRSPEDRERQRDESQYGCKGRKDHRTRSLHSRFDDSVITIKSLLLICFNLTDEDQRVTHQDAS